MEEKLTQAEEVLEKTFNYLDRILNDNRENEESAGKGRYVTLEEDHEADEKSASSV
jgi:hypothetical protein